MHPQSTGREYIRTFNGRYLLPAFTPTRPPSQRNAAGRIDLWYYDSTSSTPGTVQVWEVKGDWNSEDEKSAHTQAQAYVNGLQGQGTNAVLGAPLIIAPSTFGIYDQKCGPSSSNEVVKYYRLENSSYPGVIAVNSIGRRVKDCRTNQIVEDTTSMSADDEAPVDTSVTPNPPIPPDPPEPPQPPEPPIEIPQDAPPLVLVKLQENRVNDVDRAIRTKDPDYDGTARPRPSQTRGAFDRRGAQLPAASFEKWSTRRQPCCCARASCDPCNLPPSRCHPLVLACAR